MRSALFIVESQNYNKIAVVGDIHGDSRILDAILKFVDLNRDLLIFLGDYADRGPFGVETIRNVARLKEDYPKNVIALKGNHEDFTEAGEPKFRPCTIINEVKTKIGSWDDFFKKELKPFIDNLQLSALIPNNALLVHGGVSRKLSKIDNLMFPSEQLKEDILWSDPFNGKGERRNRERGVGIEFGADITSYVCNTLGVGRIIRSHQPERAMIKPSYVHEDRVITVHSTTMYGGLPFVFFVGASSSKNDHYKNIQKL